MSHCNFGYFKYCDGLVKSIRHSGNDHHIILKLLDFNKEQKKFAKSQLKDIKDIDLDFIDSKETEFWLETKSNLNANTENHPGAATLTWTATEDDTHKAKVFKLYTDCRPFLIYDTLRKYDDDILAICANSLVLTKLEDLEATLKKKDLVFKERETWFGLKTIEDVANLSKGKNLEASLLDCHTAMIAGAHPSHEINEYVTMWEYMKQKDGKLNLEQTCHLPISRVVLIGALGIANNPLTKEFIKTWKDYILQERELHEPFFASFMAGGTLNEFFRDQLGPNQKIEIVGTVADNTREDDSFIRAYINVGLSGHFGRKMTKETNLWDGNIVDSSCTSNKIWFAKGSVKHGGGSDEKGKRYLEKLKYFIEGE